MDWEEFKQEMINRKKMLEVIKEDLLKKKDCPHFKPAFCKDHECEYCTGYLDFAKKKRKKKK